MLLFSASSWFSTVQPVLFLTVLPSLFPLFLSSFFPFLSKIIKVRVIDDEEYEKNKTFYLEISGPRLVGSNDTKGQEGGWGGPRDLLNPGHIAEASCPHPMEEI